MIAGSFGVISLIGREGDIGHDVDDYRGLARSRPALALAFAVFLFAQAGVPLTSGFFAKFYVITAAVDAGSYWLAVVAMVSAVIAAYLYLRIIVSMYMGDESEDGGGAERFIPIPTGVAIALVIALVVTIGAGVWPGAISHFADNAIPALVASG
jgi:NADH-quinone oxidoreductase subunit N